MTYTQWFWWSKPDSLNKSKLRRFKLHTRKVTILVWHRQYHAGAHPPEFIRYAASHLEK